MQNKKNYGKLPPKQSTDLESNLYNCFQNLNAWNWGKEDICQIYRLNIWNNRFNYE